MTLLIGTESGATNLDGESLLEGERITHMAAEGETWWAVDGRGHIFRDGTEMATMPETVTAQCIQPIDKTVWIGANGGRLYALGDDGLTEDEFFAEAPGRDKWYTPWGAPADVRSMAADADRTLYINVHVGGILRYDNTGVTPTIDIDSDVHQVTTHPTLPGAVFAACAYGLAASRNGHDFAIRSDGLHADYCRAVAILDDRVLLSASTGPRSDRARLYRGELWSGTFEPLTHGLPAWFDTNLDTHHLVSRAGSAYAAQGGTVWRSDDGGDTWDVAISDLPEITCLG